jgi:hypothetical protein
MILGNVKPNYRHTVLHATFCYDVFWSKNNYQAVTNS